MTAAKVIDQLKALPPEERAKVVEFVHEMEAARGAHLMEPRTFEQATHSGL